MPTPILPLSDDLGDCASEPIHIPGSIQPHGALVAFDPGSLQVLQASANVEAYLGMPYQQLLDSSVAAAFPGDVVARLRDVPALGAPAARWRFEVAGCALEASLHRHDGIAVLEVEAADDAAAAARGALLGEGLRELAAADALPQLLATTARVVRTLTGFDRVVVYGFDADDHGEVLSEARTDDVEAYLGLHFPESDIPRQARELYRRNWIRAIPDARYEPVPLVALLRSGSGRPLDLSQAALRSVSPVHLRYLANMGLRASMSVSLIVDRRLWGLISCGHRQPHALPQGLRDACETIGRVVSSQISALATLDLQRRQASNADVQRRLVATLDYPQAHGLAGLSTESDALLALTRATGAAIVGGETVWPVGLCPEPSVLLSLAHWVRERADADGCFRTRQLAVDDARWASVAGFASGVLAVVLPTPEPACVLWLRPELVQTVEWAGEPGKTVEHDAASGADILTPRRSFALWRQEVRNRSLDWGRAEVTAAAELRRSAIARDLVRQVEAARAAVQARDDLVAVVAHDLRSPMSVIVLQAALIQRLYAQDTTETAQRLKASAQTIRRAGERMTALLNDLLDLSRIEAGRFEIALAPLHADAVVQDAVDLLGGLTEGKNLRLVVESSSLAIRGDAERLFQVFSNLIGNAVKFSPPDATIRVGAAASGRMCEFSVADSGSGIAPDHLPRIFERYWQGRPSGAFGAGLGLYIARGIVEAHGGRISAQSSPGVGTTVRFTVPLAAAET